jgi:hypothetical protein
MMKGLVRWLGLISAANSPIEQAAERRPYWIQYLETQLAALEALAAQGGRTATPPAPPMAGTPALLSERSMRRLQESD